MNNHGDITLKEFLGIAIFIIATLVFFFPLVGKSWAVFKGVSDKEKSDVKLNLIFEKVEKMVSENISEDRSILLDSPRNWFLVGSGDKLCICKNLAKDDENQEEVCKRYGGVCSEMSYAFKVDSYEVDNSRMQAIVGRQYAIKFEVDNFLVIRKDKNNSFIFRPSSAETELNDLLMDYLSSKIIYNGKQQTIGEFVKDACENPELFYEKLFEKHFYSFFNSEKIPEGERIRVEFGNRLSLGSENYGLISSVTLREINYPEDSQFSNNFVPNGKFSTKLPTTYEILNDDCVVYLTSTTGNLN